MKTRQILVVDDMAAMRQALQKNLRLMGVKDIFVAANGHEAISELNKQAFDLVICDWNMPVMNGYELLLWVRQSEKHKDTAFIMVTAEDTKANVQKAIAAGVNDFIIKPFTANTLRRKVGAVIRNPRQRPTLAAELNPNVNVINELIGEDTTLDLQDLTLPSTILIVDDVSTNIEVLSEQLKGLYKIKAATNGRRALDIAQSNSAPDLILLDIMMPDMDGLEVCRKLKNNPLTCDIPVIFLSALGDEHMIDKGLSLGAVDYVTKPSQATVLKARIRTHLGLKNQADKLRLHNTMLRKNSELRDDIERMTQHDLKAPLSAIICNLEDLQEQKSAQINAQSDSHEGAFWQRSKKENGPTLRAELKALELIDNSAHHLLYQINNTLDLYKMETGRYASPDTPADLLRVCYAVMHEHRALALAKEVTIIDKSRLDTLYTRGDKWLLHCMLSNLVKNAIEASPPLEKIEIIMRMQDPINIEIINHGLVPENIRQNFFGKYVSSKTEGTGLGTYSARLIAQASGGDLNMSCDTSTKRTHVYIELPLVSDERGKHGASE